MRLIGAYALRPQQRDFWLFGLDVTPCARPYARCLPDRGWVYHPTMVPGNKPIVAGHAYSALALLPEKGEVGIAQVNQLLQEDSLPWHPQLCVQVADSDYSTVEFLGPMMPHANLVTIVRVASNRVFYRQPEAPSEEAPSEKPTKRRHPTWYGARFDLKDATTWGPPDACTQISATSYRGKSYTLCLEEWSSLLMTGTRKYPMHQYPFSLIRVRRLDDQGKQRTPHPMWLLKIGARRAQLSLQESCQVYQQRFDMEHFFRLGKQRLLLEAYQTPDMQHEQNWWQLGQLAYVQLFLARQLADAMPRPWERYLPSFRQTDFTQTHPLQEAPQPTPGMT